MTKTKESSREQLLINILPAALVLALYAFLFAIPAQRQLQDSTNRLNTTTATAIDSSVAELSKQNLDLAQAGLVRLNEQIKQDRQQIAFLGQQWSNGKARLSTVQQVTELLQQFNLSIVSQKFEQEPPLSTYLKELAVIIGNHSDDEETLEYWQIELAGGYPDMMKFLSQIKTSGMRTFPVTLTMKASDVNDGVHTWTVVFVV
jgi:hypothetical protein